MRDPYSVLGVAKSADADGIKSAYRKLAKRYHPDMNPGDVGVEKRFKEASSAYDLLSDPVKRRKFDAGLIDAEGKERMRSGGFENQFRQRPAGAPPGEGSFESEFGGGGKRFGGDDHLFSELFETFGGRRNRGPARGEDVRATLGVSFLDAAKGASKRIRLPTDRQVDARVPAGTETGQALRLAGLGREGANGGKAGDAIVEITVAPHAFFRREGLDIWVDLPISLKEAVLGAQVSTPTIDGPVKLKVPAGADSGSVLRLKGRGLAKAGSAKDRGDQFVRLAIKLPVTIDPQLKAAIEATPDDPIDPRQRAGLT
ncbi:MAG: DnaJ C-terminal domain-containing protein [Alphaproteobacteria bacterium]